MADVAQVNRFSQLYRLVQIVGDPGFPLYIFMMMIGICIWCGYWTNLIPQYVRES
jgi:hypothetical protein